MYSLGLEVISKNDLANRMMVAAACSSLTEFHYSIKITVYDEENNLVDDYLYSVEIHVGSSNSTDSIEVKDENGRIVMRMYVDSYNTKDEARIHSMLNNIPRLLFDYHDYLVFEERHEDE